MSKKLRFVDAKLFVKSLGLTLSAHQGEFIVSIPGNLNRKADYVTNDLKDAVATAVKMAKKPTTVGAFLNTVEAKSAAEFSGMSKITDFSADSDGRVAINMSGDYTVDELKLKLADLQRVQNTFDAQKTTAIKQAAPARSVSAAQRVSGLLTENEFQVLQALDESEYGDYLNSVVWSFTIADNSKLSGRTISGACGSLAKKGFIRTSGCGGDDTIQMTDEGIKAYQAACDLRSIKSKKEARSA